MSVLELIGGKSGLQGAGNNLIFSDLNPKYDTLVDYFISIITVNLKSFCNVKMKVLRRLRNLKATSFEFCI